MPINADDVDELSFVSTLAESYVGEEVPMEEISMDDVSVTHDIHMGCRTDKVSKVSNTVRGFLQKVSILNETHASTGDLAIELPIPLCDLSATHLKMRILTSETPDCVLNHRKNSSLPGLYTCQCHARIPCKALGECRVHFGLAISVFTPAHVDVLALRGRNKSLRMDILCSTLKELLSF